MASMVSGAEVLGVGGREADAADAGHGGDHPQEVGEQRADSYRVAGVPGGQGEVPSVAVHVLAQQGDLGDAVAGERFHLGDDVRERPADLRAADSRDDAERAGVVAADLDRDPRVVPVVAPGRQRGGEAGVVVRDGLGEDLGDGP